MDVICVVRRQEQVDILKEMGCKYIANSSAEDFKSTMEQFSKDLKPTGCIEAIAGDITGEMMGYLGNNSTCILYGLLSEKSIGNIDPLAFIGKNQTIQAFFLGPYIQSLSPEGVMKLFGDNITLYKTHMVTQINRRYGLDKVKEAFEYYVANQTAGKVIFKPELTGKTEWYFNLF